MNMLRLLRSKRRRDFLGQILRSSQRKYALWWLQSLERDYLLKKPLPWICFEAIEFISTRLSEGMRVFEYGSGGSTLFWLKHGACLTSIEHNDSWYDMLRGRYLNTATVDYRLVPPQPTEQNTLDYSNPDAYISASKAYVNCSFQNYCTQIEQFPDAHFDLVLIDGRARPSCIKHSVKKVKFGGLLVLDNSSRERYLQLTSAVLDEYARDTFSGVTPASVSLSETSVFTRKM